MRKTQYHILTLIIVFSSCTNDKTNTDNKDKGLTKVNTDVQATISDSLTSDIIKVKADEFINSTLDSNTVHWTFNPTDKDLPKYISVFRQDGIEKVFAYSLKTFIKPREYDHFVLFLIKYKTTELSKKSFNEFQSDSEAIAKLEKQNELNTSMPDRLNQILVLTKYGGLIGQKDNYILSLVETCGPNYVNLSWTKYEDRFIKSIFDKSDNGSTILNADCGDILFEKQKVK